MKVKYFSKQFENFFIERMTGEELVRFDVQSGLYAKYPLQHGLFHSDVTARPGGRTVRFTYYSAAGLQELFVVGAHLVRRGEPKDWDQRQMDEYVDAIQSWESHPGSRPETFETGEEG